MFLYAWLYVFTNFNSFFFEPNQVKVIKEKEEDSKDLLSFNCNKIHTLLCEESIKLLYDVFEEEEDLPKVVRNFHELIVQQNFTI